VDEARAVVAPKVRVDEPRVLRKRVYGLVREGEAVFLDFVAGGAQ
jgi:hypothetical protein